MVTLAGKDYRRANPLLLPSHTATYTGRDDSTNETVKAPALAVGAGQVSGPCPDYLPDYLEVFL